MAFDVLLRRETGSNWARGPEAPVLPLEFSPAERRALKQLEPSTAAHVVEVIGWARSRGIPAKLSSSAVIYTPEDVARNYAEGRSGIDPGRLSWHSVGRAYHLVIIAPGTRKLDEPAYERVAKFVRSKGGDWLGDKLVPTKRGPVKDTAHFEFHPDWDIATYRRLPVARTEYAAAQKRAARYG